MASYCALGFYPEPHHSASTPSSQFLGLLVASRLFHGPSSSVPSPCSPTSWREGCPAKPASPLLFPAALYFSILPSRPRAEPKRLTLLLRALHTVGSQ